tara:strand:+ start:400 stop:888 length:489 start_codon:yes stop_codon:yes gene_type:complete
MAYEVIDNYFDEKYFGKLQHAMMEPASPIGWEYLPAPSAGNENDLSCMFTHLVFEHKQYSEMFDMFDVMWSMFDIKSLIRIKLNLYPSSQTLLEHAVHQDYNFNHKGAIIYINDNDGFTRLEDGTCIESKANRVLFFDASQPHSSTNCTNAKARFNINVNYF